MGSTGGGSNGNDVTTSNQPSRHHGLAGVNHKKRTKQDRKDEEKWVQCQECEKWRLLPLHVDIGALPEKWYDIILGLLLSTNIASIALKKRLLYL